MMDYKFTRSRLNIAYKTIDRFAESYRIAVTDRERGNTDSCCYEFIEHCDPLYTSNLVWRYESRKKIYEVEEEGNK